MVSKNLASVGPTSSSDRILSLDVLRGVAVFGILVVNIQVFSMIFAALSNPEAFGDLTGLNYVVALFTYVFAAQKFMTIFSILFGAGVLLMIRNIEARSEKAAGRHYRRMMWLILIGLLHAYLLWYGDILVSYGFCGLLIYLFRNMSARKLLIIGLIAIFIGSAIMILVELSLPSWPKEMVENTRQSWQPGEDIIAEEIAIYRGGWQEQMVHRVPAAMGFQTFVFFMMVLWRAGGLMLIGMALFKWGILTAEASKKIYRNFLIIGLPSGLVLVSLGWIISDQHDWALEYAMFRGLQFNYWGSLLLSLAYIGGVMLLCRAKGLFVIKRPLAAVGRMAFTNYLMHTVICTIIFYGHGFGLFGRVSRTWQMLIVLFIFAFQLWLCPWWLKHFRFGPIEWLWRSLTYRKIQPMRVKSLDFGGPVL
jgi:uncharacterized protein